MRERSVPPEPGDRTATCVSLFDMPIRALCVVILLCFSPISTWAASSCCKADAKCCGEETADCPVLPDGSCSIAAASRTLAAVSPQHEQLPALPVFTLEFEATLALTGSSLTGSSLDPHPLRFPLHRPLRI